MSAWLHGRRSHTSSGCRSKSCLTDSRLDSLVLLPVPGAVSMGGADGTDDRSVLLGVKIGAAGFSAARVGGSYGGGDSLPTDRGVDNRRPNRWADGSGSNPGPEFTVPPDHPLGKRQLLGIISDARSTCVCCGRARLMWKRRAMTTPLRTWISCSVALINWRWYPEGSVDPLKVFVKTTQPGSVSPSQGMALITPTRPSSTQNWSPRLTTAWLFPS